MTLASSETGAVTVDWVVLTAGLVGLGLAVISVVDTGVQDASGDIANALQGNLIRTSFLPTTSIVEDCAAWNAAMNATNDHVNGYNAGNGQVGGGSFAFLASMECGDPTSMDDATLESRLSTARAWDAERTAASAAYIADVGLANADLYDFAEAQGVDAVIVDTQWLPTINDPNQYNGNTQAFIEGRVLADEFLAQNIVALENEANRRNLDL